jgi:hypothetical protein
MSRRRGVNTEALFPVGWTEQDQDRFLTGESTARSNTIREDDEYQVHGCFV